MSSLEKVTIMSVEDENVFKNIYVTSMYNPKELSFTKSVDWARVPSGSRADFPNLQYTSGSAIDLTVELFFDTLDIALAQSHAAIATKLIAEESDIAVAVAITIAPKEGPMGLDMPEFFTRTIGHALE